MLNLLSNTKENFQKNTSIIRRNMLHMIFYGKTGTGHIGSSLSIADIIFYLCKNVIFSQKKKKNHFILSKGHAAPILYSMLFSCGFLTKKDLHNFRTFNSRLQGHPDKTKLSILDSGSGALGQGLSTAIGYAIGNKLKNNRMKAYCLIGDGEMQEGQIWESALYAGSKKLNNLCAIIDSNKFQNEFSVKDTLEINDIKRKWESFGWEFIRINGHSFKDLEKSFSKMNKPRKKPLLIYADTFKGKGVSFMENDNFWHSGIMKKEDFENAISELDNQI